MARPGLIDHPKFRRLVHLLQIPEPYALGLLEFLWRVAYQDGNPRIGDGLDVELAAKWPGDQGKLCEALLNCGGPGRAGFIEPVPGEEGAYQVHDLDDHAPDYVRSRRRMEGYRKRKRQDREAINSESLRNGSGPLRNSDGSPAPAPAPINPPTPLKGGECGFEELWKAYPPQRRADRKAAEKEWAKLSPAADQVVLILAALERQKESARWRKEEGQYVPKLGKWLREHQWDGALTNGQPPKETKAERDARIKKLREEDDAAQKAAHRGPMTGRGGKAHA
jgi:hypothetical protein